MVVYPQYLSFFLRNEVKKWRIGGKGNRKEGRKKGVEREGKKERERGKEGKKTPTDVHYTIFLQ